MLNRVIQVLNIDASIIKNIPILKYYDVIFDMMLMSIPFLDEWHEKELKARNTSLVNVLHAGRNRLDIRLIYACILAQEIVGKGTHAFVCECKFNKNLWAIIYSLARFEDFGILEDPNKLPNIPSATTIDRYRSYFFNDGLLHKICKDITNKGIESVKTYNLLVAQGCLYSDKEANEQLQCCKFIDKKNSVDSSIFDVSEPDYDPTMREDRKKCNQEEFESKYPVEKLVHIHYEGGKTYKNKQYRFGFKIHIISEHSTKIIRIFKVTDASQADVSVVEDLVKPLPKACNEILGDAAYVSKNLQTSLKEKRNIELKAVNKRKRNQPELTPEQKAENHEISKSRIRVEHPFASMHYQFKFKLRRIGKESAKACFLIWVSIYNTFRKLSLINGTAKLKAI